MSRAPQVALLGDGRRLHLQDGPIDLVIEASGTREATEAAYAAAVARFTGLLDELCAELGELRAPARPWTTALRGRVARRMHAAVAPFAADIFITPMAAVAGAVAGEICAAMTGAARLERAYVNNGGDIALHLANDAHFTVGLVDRPDRPALTGTARIGACDGVRGVATSGRHGRSFSLGIADAVTVLAASAAEADAAATVIANAVDLPDHPAVTRVPACELQPDSDLGALPVTRSVGALGRGEIEEALAAGATVAGDLARRGLIRAAALRLCGESRMVGFDAIATAAPAVYPSFTLPFPQESPLHA